MTGSLKLKKAIATGRVTVFNHSTGEVRVFLYNPKDGSQFFVDVPPHQKLELAPKLSKPMDLLNSRNLESLLTTSLRLV